MPIMQRPPTGTAKSATSLPAMLPYHGKVRVLLPFDPWRLLVSLRGIQLSAQGVEALYERSLPGQDSSLQDSIDALMVEGDPYELQLEHDEPHLAAPVLLGHLTRRAHGIQGLELGFSFDNADSDLLGLLHELAHKL